jgi:hypothetical protein
VFDIGRWAIVVTVGQSSRTVFVDTDYVVDDCDRFERGRQAILSLGKELGVDFDWGPYGWTVGPAID